jgi:hypothetical protein
MHMDIAGVMNSDEVCRLHIQSSVCCVHVRELGPDPHTSTPCVCACDGGHNSAMRTRPRG